MKRLTTLALLAGMLSAPALHSEDTPPDALPPLNFPLPDAEASGASAPASEANRPPSTEPRRQTSLSRLRYPRCRRRLHLGSLIRCR